MKKVAVTGAGGYIGTQLVRDLLNEGYEVLAIDRYFFGMEPMKEFIGNKKITILRKDIRDLDIKDLRGINAVCDLACLSNDPAGEIDSSLTNSINKEGRIHLGKTAKNAGIKRYIISSSCSVYGNGAQENLTEDAETNPLSLYAKTTLEAETHNLLLSDNNFCVTSLRNSTVFGISTRMRFDLVVNLMTLSAFQKNRIVVLGGGDQWRPLIHIKDVSKAFITVLEKDEKIVNNQIYNTGLDNFKIKNIANIIKGLLPINVEIELAPDDVDKRNYSVDFSKIKAHLDYSPTVGLEKGIIEIFNALKNGEIDTGDRTVTVKWYKAILNAKKLLEEVELENRVI